jgi:pyruvate formate-lyase activating enzyme-like uncharacterized protein
MINYLLLAIIGILFSQCLYCSVNEEKKNKQIIKEKEIRKNKRR